MYDVQARPSSGSVRSIPSTRRTVDVPDGEPYAESPRDAWQIIGDFGDRSRTFERHVPEQRLGQRGRTGVRPHDDAPIEIGPFVGIAGVERNLHCRARTGGDFDRRHPRRAAARRAHPYVAAPGFEAGQREPAACVGPCLSRGARRADDLDGGVSDRAAAGIDRPSDQDRGRSLRSREAGQGGEKDRRASQAAR